MNFESTNESERSAGATPTQTSRPANVPSDLSIDAQRLHDDLSALARIGRDDDRGITRRAFTDADRAGRDWFRQRAESAGLEVYEDGAANLSALLPGADPGAPRVLVGSHLDTVPGGGPLDGAYGVLAGLEALRVLKDRGVTLPRSLEVVDFTDEEGRFGGLFGSQALAGQMTPERIHSARDLEGVRLEDAMREWGLDPERALTARRDPKSIRAFVELHIEQGPVLDQSRQSIGVVEAITGLFKWEVRLIGQANHAGTTPMNLRRDAFQGLAEFAGEIDRLLEEHGGPNSRTTIGRVELKPGAANTVPGLAIFSLEARDTSPRILEDLARAMRRTLSSIARRRDLMFEFDVLSEITPVACDAHVIETIAAAAEARGIKGHRMPSGAAHDAQIMASIVPTAMIFVPSLQGRSHSSAEWTNAEDLECGANVLLETMIRLAA
ncbi:MAG: Zn-dependent hydrolase [Thioalkalivibrionaceae bacterium]